jgi:hypothetical protein
MFPIFQSFKNQKQQQFFVSKFHPNHFVHNSLMLKIKIKILVPQFQIELVELIVKINKQVI